MSENTPFSGILALSADDPLSIDGYRFTGTDRRIIDRLLQIGAVAHIHDEHPRLADPLASAMASASTGASGQILGGTDISIGYTLLDAQGGETALSPVEMVTTPAPITPPEDPPSFTVDQSLGALRAGDYVYALTLKDGIGGETTAGTPFIVTIQQGGGDGRVFFTGLSAILASSGAAGWKLYRGQGGGRLEFLAEGTGDAFTDDGLTCAYGIVPPQANTTNSNNSIQVVIPSGPGGVDASEGATGFVLYLDTDGAFDSPSRYAQYELSDADTVINIDSLVLDEGSPPPVSTTVGGAHKIDASNIANLTWSAPVAASGSLPASANYVGEAKVVMDDRKIYAWLGSSWEVLYEPVPDSDEHLGSVVLGSGSVLDISQLEFAAGSGISLNLEPTASGARLTIGLA